MDNPVTPGENSGLKNQTTGIAADQSSDRELNSANPLEQASLEPLAIKRIHMLLDASERQHLFENLANYSNVLSQYHVSPGKVYIFGQPEIPSDAPYDWMRILAKGGKIGANYKIAEIYGITRSPSWILETEEGDVVFEAYESIDRFLTHKGELKRKYLEPEMDPIVGAEDEST